MQEAPNRKEQNERRKARPSQSRPAAKELNALFDEDKPSATAQWLEAIKILFTLMVKLINPLNWKKLYYAIYCVWLQRNNRYEKLLAVWAAKTPETPAAKVFISVQMVDCYIQLGRLSEGMSCLKGLTEEIDTCDAGNEWKEEMRQKVKFYRNTIHSLASQRIEKRDERQVVHSILSLIPKDLI